MSRLKEELSILTPDVIQEYLDSDLKVAIETDWTPYLSVISPLINSKSSKDSTIHAYQISNSMINSMQNAVFDSTVWRFTVDNASWGGDWICQPSVKRQRHIENREQTKRTTATDFVVYPVGLADSDADLIEFSRQLTEQYSYFDSPAKSSGSMLTIIMPPSDAYKLGWVTDLGLFSCLSPSVKGLKNRIGNHPIHEKFHRKLQLRYPYLFYAVIDKLPLFNESWAIWESVKFANTSERRKSGKLFIPNGMEVSYIEDLKALLQSHQPLGSFVEIDGGRVFNSSLYGQRLGFSLFMQTWLADYNAALERYLRENKKIEIEGVNQLINQVDVRNSDALVNNRRDHDLRSTMTATSDFWGDLEKEIKSNPEKYIKSENSDELISFIWNSLVAFVTIDNLSRFNSDSNLIWRQLSDLEKTQVIKQFLAINPRQISLVFSL